MDKDQIEKMANHDIFMMICFVLNASCIKSYSQSDLGCPFEKHYWYSSDDSLKEKPRYTYRSPGLWVVVTCQAYGQGTQVRIPCVKWERDGRQVHGDQKTIPRRTEFSFLGWCPSFCCQSDIALQADTQ